MRIASFLKLEGFSWNQRLRLFGLLGVLTLVWACYPVTDTGFSNPQNSGANQWMIEFRTGEEKVQLTMRSSRKRDEGSSGWGFIASRSLRISYRV